MGPLMPNPMPDRRLLVGMDMLEQEAQHRLNPYDPTDPTRPPEPPSRRRGLRALWARLRAFLGLKQEDNAQAN